MHSAGGRARPRRLLQSLKPESAPVWLRCRKRATCLEGGSNGERARAGPGEVGRADGAESWRRTYAPGSGKPLRTVSGDSGCREGCTQGALEGPDGQREMAEWISTECFWRQGSQDVGVSKGSRAAPGRMVDRCGAAWNGETGLVQKAELGPSPRTSELCPATVPPSPGSEEGTLQKG